MKKGECKPGPSPHARCHILAGMTSPATDTWKSAPSEFCSGLFRFYLPEGPRGRNSRKATAQVCSIHAMRWCRRPQSNHTNATFISMQQLTRCRRPQGNRTDVASLLHLPVPLKWPSCRSPRGTTTRPTPRHVLGFGVPATQYGGATGSRSLPRTRVTH